MLSSGDYPEYLLKYYILLEYKHFKLVKGFNEECNGDLVPILFFITKNCPNCDTMAAILTNLKQKYPEKVYVYTFNASITSPIVSYLLRLYDVNEFPTIVVEKNRCNVCSLRDLESVVIGS